MNAIARQQFAARKVLVARRLIAARTDLRNFRAQIGDECAHGFGIGEEIRRA